MRRTSRLLAALAAALACGPLAAASPSSHLNRYGPGYAFTPRANWSLAGTAWSAGVRPSEVGESDRGYGLAFSHARGDVLVHLVYGGDLDDEADSLGVAAAFRVVDGGEEDRFWPDGLSLSAHPFFVKADAPDGGPGGDHWGAAAAVGFERGRLTLTGGVTWLDGDTIEVDHGAFGSLGWLLAEDLQAFFEATEESSAARGTTAAGLLWRASDTLAVQVDYRVVDGSPGGDEESLGVSVTLYTG